MSRDENPIATLYRTHVRPSHAPEGEGKWPVDSVRCRSVLVDLVRCVGVALGLWAAFLTAPSGTRRLLNLVARWFTKARRKMLTLLPWRRSHTIHGHGVPASASVGLTGHLTTAAAGWVWSPQGSVDDRIELL